MILIDSNAIGNAAPIREWIQAMENAFRDTATGKIDVPRRMHIDRGENSLILMPCFGEKYFSTKLVSVYPKNLQKKRPVIHIGSYKPDMREFPDQVIGDVECVYVDTLHGISESGDLLQPLEKGLIRKEQIVLLGDLVTGKASPKGETRFFKSVGMAAFDLYGARLVYENMSMQG